MRQWKAKLADEPGCLGLGSTCTSQQPKGRRAWRQPKRQSQGASTRLPWMQQHTQYGPSRLGLRRKAARKACLQFVHKQSLQAHPPIGAHDFRHATTHGLNRSSSTGVQHHRSKHDGPSSDIGLPLGHIGSLFYGAGEHLRHCSQEQLRARQCPASIRHRKFRMCATVPSGVTQMSVRFLCAANIQNW